MYFWVFARVIWSICLVTFVTGLICFVLVSFCHLKSVTRHGTEMILMLLWMIHPCIYYVSFLLFDWLIDVVILNQNVITWSYSEIANFCLVMWFHLHKSNPFITIAFRLCSIQLIKPSVHDNPFHSEVCHNMEQLLLLLHHNFKIRQYFIWNILSF